MHAGFLMYEHEYTAILIPQFASRHMHYFSDRVLKCVSTL